MGETSSEAYLVNKEVKDFVFDLHDATRRSHLGEEIRRLYESEFKEMCEKYCDKTPWPSAAAMASQCIGQDGEPDGLFLCLYVELGYRHLFAKLKPKVEDRVGAWVNYCELFDRILKGEDTQTTLTAPWVFDILHEFVYQFQSHCQFRTKLSSYEDDAARAQQLSDAWSASKVVGYLHDLAKFTEDNRDSSPSPLHSQFGYFALAARSRLETLLGDYSSAVECLKGIDPFDESAIFAQVFTCRLNLLYHLGFALLMLERYVESVEVLDSIVSPLARLQKTHNGFPARALPPASPPPEQVQKTFDRILGLLALAHHLAGGHKSNAVALDDASKTALKDKFGDKLALLDSTSTTAKSSNSTDGGAAGSAGETKASSGPPPQDNGLLAQLFTSSCPKFVVPASEIVAPSSTSPDDEKADPSLSGGSASAALVSGAPVSAAKHGQLDAYNQQIRLFSQHVHHHHARAKIKSYLQLYTSIGLDKLARFNDASSALFRAHLLGLKHAMLVRSDKDTSYASSPLDLHFYVHDDMIHVDEAANVGRQRQDEFLLDQILKFRHATQVLLDKPPYKSPVFSN